MNGTTVIVTGHNGGIGSAITTQLQHDGYTVLGIDSASGDGTVAELQIELANLSDQDARVEAFVVEQLGDGQLSALINCAATQITGDFQSLGRSALMHSLAANAIAPLLLTQQLLPRLETTAQRPAPGTVINIGSIHSRLTKRGFMPYAISKAALAGATRSMALELGARVRILEIQPAAIATPMLEAGFGENKEARKALADVHPTGTIGAPQDVANTVSLILQHPSSFLNGGVINLDGGLSFALKDPC